MGLLKNIFKKKIRTPEQKTLACLRQTLKDQGLSLATQDAQLARVKRLVAMNRQQRRAYLALEERELRQSKKPAPK